MSIATDTLREALTECLILRAVESERAAAIVAELEADPKHAALADRWDRPATELSALTHAGLRIAARERAGVNR